MWWWYKMSFSWSPKYLMTHTAHKVVIISSNQSGSYANFAISAMITIATIEIYLTPSHRMSYARANGNLYAIWETAWDFEFTTILVFCPHLNQLEGNVIAITMHFWHTTHQTICLLKDMWSFLLYDLSPITFDQVWPWVEYVRLCQTEKGYFNLVIKTSMFLS